MTRKSIVTANTHASKKIIRPKGNVAGRKTDLGFEIAKLVLEKSYRNGKRLIYVNEQFWTYQAGVWRTTGDREVERKILRAVENVKLTRDIAPIVKQVLELIKPMRAVGGDPFHEQKYAHPVINCRNGEVHLLDDGTIKFRDHHPQSYFDHQIEVDFNPNAKCALYSRALLDIFDGSKSMRRHWHELSGYALQESREFALVLVLYGSGGNGKTMLVRTLAQLLGVLLIYAGRVDQLAKDPRAIAHFPGKRIFVDGDVAGDTVLPDGMLKKISEEKILTGERKYHDKREVECRVVPFLLCNNIPVLSDLSPGTLRRLQVIPFNRSFLGPAQDVHLFPRIWEEEMSGVLNCMLKGFQRLQLRGRFDIPGMVQDATKKWVTNASLLQRFIEDCCIVSADEKVWGNDLYRVFGQFVKDEGTRVVPERARFYADLVHRGFGQKKGRHGQRFVGIGLKANFSIGGEKR